MPIILATHMQHSNIQPKAICCCSNPFHLKVLVGTLTAMLLFYLQHRHMEDIVVKLGASVIPH